MKTLTTIAILAVMTMFTACGQNISGIYYGEYDGTKIACQLEQHSTQLAGIIQDATGNTFEFNDVLTNGTTKGVIVINKGAYQTSYAASFNKSTCLFNIKTLTGANMELSLSKEQTSSTTATAKQPAAAGNIDPDMVGRWRRQSITSTGSGDNYAFFTSVSYVQYNADGTYSASDGSANDGGNGGKWYVKDGTLYTIKNGDTYYVKYTFHDGQLVFGTNGSYRFFSRV